MRLFGKLTLFAACLHGIGLNAQNVGIGTASPAEKLHIYSTNPVVGLRLESNQSSGQSAVSFAFDGNVITTLGVDASDANKFKIGTSSLSTGTMLTLQRNGFVGISTTNPVYHLHVAATRPENYVGYFENLATSGPTLGAYASNSFNAVGGITEHNAGIGTYGVHLPVAGVGWGVYGTSNSSDGIGVKGSVPTTGSWLGFGGYFTGGLAYVNGLYNLSDARMKTNINHLDGALDKVLMLEGVTFKYNAAQYPEFVGQDNKTYMGFVAQDVERVVPEVVAEKYLIGTNGLPAGAQADGSGATHQTVKVVDYSALVPLLVEAIKAQEQKISDLEAKLKTMEAAKSDR